MAKNEYTETFNKFWAAYPRRTAKLTAFKAWVKNGIDDDAFLPTQIIQDCEKRTRLKWWPRDMSKIPHGATWINQARWEDEGWEEEIKTREDSSRNSGPVVYNEPVNDGPKLSSWHKMLQRLMLNYFKLNGPWPEAKLKTLIKTKNDCLREMQTAIDEEIDAASDKAAARVEMAYLLGDTMLSRFDNITGLKLKSQVMKISIAGKI